MGWVCSYSAVLISANTSCRRSWAHPRRAAATCWGWCTRNPRGGHTRSRVTPVSAACGPRWNRPMGSCERLRIPCSSLSAPSTATGAAENWLRRPHCTGWWFEPIWIPLFYQVHLCSQPLWERVHEWHWMVSLPGLAWLAAQPVWQEYRARWHHLSQGITRGKPTASLNTAKRQSLSLIKHIVMCSMKNVVFPCFGSRNVWSGSTWGAGRRSRRSLWSTWRSSTLSTRAGCSTGQWSEP